MARDAGRDDFDVGLDMASRIDSSDEAILLVTLRTPEGSTRAPSDICCVVDVSGSMGTEAMVQTEAGMQSGHGLSVLDIVKHSLKTIIRILQKEDRLALVSYSNDAKTIFDLETMNEDGRKKTEEKLDELVPAGMTNLWDGLKTGVELLERGRGRGSHERLQHIMLFTDGLPNINPPRGILPMVERLKMKSGGFLPCTVSTFGFGYELDSKLLSDLAIAGGGAYAFIPDAGFVGTVFVNAMANLLVTMAKNVILKLQPKSGAAFLERPVVGGHCSEIKDGTLTIQCGTLQFGQSKDFMVRLTGVRTGECCDVTLEYNTRNNVQQTKQGVVEAQSGDRSRIAQQECRLLAVDAIRAAMITATQSSAEKAEGKAIPLDEATRHIATVQGRIDGSEANDSEQITALLEDLRGQVTEALSRQDWYTKWGVHFLPSLMSAHLSQTCNNFKDPGVQSYGGGVFNLVRDAADDIFVSLPPPRPSARPPPPAPTPAYQPSAFVGTGVRPPVAAPRPQVSPVAPVASMAMFHDPMSC